MLMVPISSRNSVPRSAISNSPFFEAMALVNAPFTCPNKVDSNRSGRHRPGIHRYKRPIVARRIQVDGFGDQFFARAALALQQNRRPAGRDLRHQVENLQHGFALAHDAFKVVALLQRALELDVFFFGLWRATAARTSASSFSLSQGFWTKFTAPACIAFTAFSTVP